MEFVPNSPTLMNAGTGAGTLSACFVIGLEDSMEGIMETAKEAALVQKFGGGTGFALSNIRPKGAPISTTHGRACGPVAVLRHLSSVSTLVTQGGKRDGANMAVMDVHHPDIMDFITCKTTEGQIHNFNISVGASDEFMQTVDRGEDYELRDPRTGQVVGKANAADVFTRIIEGAWLNGEPGTIFLDEVNRDNPTLHVGRMTATNPCGEQPLLPYESCNLGSINLAKFVVDNDRQPMVDWDGLRETVRIATRFLDNVIDANGYSVPEIERMTKLTRKIGLGVMGFADMLVMMGIPYNSQEGLNLGRSLMKFVREESDNTSEELAKERGVFPAYEGSTYQKQGRPMRNACRLTVGPYGHHIHDCRLLQRYRASLLPLLPQAQHPGWPEPALRRRQLRAGGAPGRLLQRRPYGVPGQRRLHPGQGGRRPGVGERGLCDRGGHITPGPRADAGSLPGERGCRHIQDHQLPQLGHKG